MYCVYNLNAILLHLKRSFIIMKKISLILISGLLVFSACKKDKKEETDVKDTQKPVITLEKPKDKDHFHPGDKIHADGTITDNVNLSEFKIDIHYAGDGHGHGKRGEEVEWEYVKVFPISGKSHKFHEHITIPENAKHGEYHFIVYALDAAGNAADFVEVEIEIEDHEDELGDGPSLTFTNPTHTNRIDANAGQVIQIQGTASDDKSKIKKVTVYLRDEGNNNTIVDQKNFDNLDTHNYAISTSVSIPTSGAHHADYDLKIEVENHAGQKADKHFKYHVH